MDAVWIIGILICSLLILGFTRIVIEIREQTATMREGNHEIVEHLHGLSHMITEIYTKLEMRHQPKQE
jgi:hypothetical protein